MILLLSATDRWMYVETASYAAWLRTETAEGYANMLALMLEHQINTTGRVH